MKTGAARGFTLPETLLTLAIVGVLAALALPAYRDHLLRSARSEARLELMEVAAELERYHSRHGRYIDDARPLWGPEQAGRRRLTRQEQYEIEVQACPENDLRTCFVAVAWPRGAQSRDICGALRLSSDGARDAQGAAEEDCWR